MASRSVAGSGGESLRGFIAFDVPYAFRDELPGAARLDLAFSDAIKEAASRRSVGEMVFCMERFAQWVASKREGLDLWQRACDLQRQLMRGGNPMLASFALGARAFEIDSRYVPAVRQPSRLSFLDPAVKRMRDGEVARVLKARRAIIRDGAVLFAATAMDLADARHLLRTSGRASAERPGGLQSSRIAFFIASNAEALSSPGGLAGGALFARMGRNGGAVAFSIERLQILGERALSADKWLAALVRVQDESRARLASREAGRSPGR